jgi:hypothetical protein
MAALVSILSLPNRGGERKETIAKIIEVDDVHASPLPLPAVARRHRRSKYVSHVHLAREFF